METHHLRIWSADRIPEKTHLCFKKCLFACSCYPLVFQIFDNELKDQEREVCFVDIAYDEIPERYYKESEVSESLLLNYY